MADYYSELRVIFQHNESSNYEGVNKNDNGALSIGLLQWHAARALGLMRNIAAIDADVVRNNLGDDLYNQIISGNNNVWNNYIITGSSDPWKAVLGSAAGIQAQDALFETDTGNYLSQAKAMGISDLGAQLYFADLYNQSPKQALNIARACNGDMSLETLYKKSLQNSVMGQYKGRRDWTYQYCSGVSGTTPITPPVNPPPKNPNQSGESGGGGQNIENVTDYFFLIQNGEMAMLYNDNFPNGRMYFKAVDGLYLPKKAYTNQ